jgi:hypothetical protein
MTKKELERLLTEHFQHPQSSERWAMYRLIAPVVDYANSSLGLTSYFEFNQTSEHGGHQSVDIALLNDDYQPLILIEAKRWDRTLTPEQIDKYLQDDVRGVVSNGALWLLCESGKHVCMDLFAESKLQIEALNTVVSFIRGARNDSLVFSSETAAYRTTVKPLKIEKTTKAGRKTHAISTVSTPAEFTKFVGSLEKTPVIEQILLRSIASALHEIGQQEFLNIEARDTRISFFDSRINGRSKRVARIELGKQNPDVLVLTDVVEQGADLGAIVTPFMHDKGAHMRSFRIPDEGAAERFGIALVSSLTLER